MVTSDYSHIWDCCCDHGHLGTALLTRNAAQYIHFVDIVPELIETLENKLQHFHEDSETRWEALCQDVSTLPLSRYEGRQLIIIAGVGGDLMTKFIEDLHLHHPKVDVDFLLCPVHHQFTLRNKLNSLGFSCKQEALVEDNQRFYEVMLVSPPRADRDIDKLSAVSLVGESFWLSAIPEQDTIAQKYLAKTLAHYQRIQQGKKVDVQHIIDAYNAVTVS